MPGTRGLHTEGRALPYRQWTKLMAGSRNALHHPPCPSIDVAADVGGRRMNVTAALRMRTDSVVMLSIIPFLGIEMFTLELYPDRWMLYDRVNRTYYTESYEYFALKMGRVGRTSPPCSRSSPPAPTPPPCAAPTRRMDVHLDAGRAAIERTAAGFTQRLTASAAHTVEQVAWSTADGPPPPHGRLQRLRRQPRGELSPAHRAGPHLRRQPLARVELTLRRVTFNGDLRLNPADPARYKRGQRGPAGRPAANAVSRPRLPRPTHPDECAKHADKLAPRAWDTERHIVFIFPSF